MPKEDKINNMNSAAYLVQAKKILADTGFKITDNFSDQSSRAATPLLATNKTRVLGIFPVVDYVQFLDLTGKESDVDLLMNSHNSLRAYVDATIKTPKMWRLSVPNVMTVGLSPNDFDSTVMESVARSTHIKSGGEKHSLYLVQLTAGRVYSQDKQQITGRDALSGLQLKMTPERVDPTNRGYNLIRELTDNIFNQ